MDENESTVESTVESTPESGAIAERLTSMIEHLGDAYSAVKRKSGKLPVDKNLENLANAIGTITGGGGGGSVELPVGLTEDWGTIAGITNKPISVKFGAEEDFNAFCNSCAQALKTINVSLGVMPRNEVTSFYIGNSCTNVPDNFLMSPDTVDPTERFCENLQYVTLNTAQIVGDNFLRNNTLFNGEIVLGEQLQSVGDYFMGKNYTFDQPITLPDSLKNVGESFLYACNKLPELYIPKGVNPPGDRNSLSCDNQNATAYLAGLRLKGPGASKWVAALPNRDTVPFRNLIATPTSEVWRRVRIQFDNYKSDKIEPVLDGQTATKPEPAPTYVKWYYDTPIVAQDEDDNCKLPITMALQGYVGTETPKREAIIEFDDGKKAQTVLVENGSTLRERFSLNDSLKVLFGNGREFLGWKQCEPSELVYHTVTIDPANGEEPRVTQIYNGYKVNEPKTPEKEGYKFLGWTDEEPVYHTVTFEDGENTITLTVPHGQPVGYHAPIQNFNPETLMATDGNWSLVEE